MACPGWGDSPGLALVSATASAHHELTAYDIVERFALSDGDTRLMWTATVTDPETFTEPVELPIINYEWQPGSQVRPFGCDQIE